VVGRLGAVGDAAGLFDVAVEAGVAQRVGVGVEAIKLSIVAICSDRPLRTKQFL
jgi:hypothetical protein